MASAASVVTWHAPTPGRHASRVIEGRVAHVVSSPDRGFPITSCYGVNVIVITCKIASHWTLNARVSATNRRGRSVLPALMTGTTLGLVSMVTDLLLSFATFLPIHNSTVVPFRTMVALCADAFQVMVPPVASTTALMGSRVRELRIMGVASKVADCPSTYIVTLPTLSWRTFLVFLANEAVIFLSAFIVTVTGFFIPVRDPDQPVKAYPVAGLAVSVTTVSMAYEVALGSRTTDPPAEGDM